MKKKLLALALIAAAVAIPVHAVLALIAAPPPGPARVVNADAVFVGKVMAIEPVDVEVKNVKYRIAVVQISQGILGVKDEKSIRVGFIPFTPPQPGKPIIGGGNRNPQLQAGQEGLFMLRRHPDGAFYQAPMFGYFVAAQQKDFEGEVKTAKKIVSIMADPKTSLNSKDAEERLLAAAVQVNKYRTAKSFPNKQEPIDAEESKMILNAIVTAKWDGVKFGQTNPQQLFYQLGITEKDGWVAPRNVKSVEEIRQAAEVWLREKGGSYRIQRFVAAEKQ